MNNNWYAYLGLSPEATAEEIQGAVERLSRQASALAATSPERSQLLRETIRAIKRDLLSGPENRRRYDALTPQQLAPAAPMPGYRPKPAAVPPPPAGPAAGSRLVRFLRTGWTCPACGKGGLPSEKFCTKCGTPIQLIRPEVTPESERPPRLRPTCSTCANPLGPTDAFCAKCGARR